MTRADAGKTIYPAAAWPEATPSKAAAELVALQETLYRSQNPTRRWLHCTRRDWILAAIARYAGEGRGRALEVGPGSGVYLPALLDHFAEVTASDIEAAYLDKARMMAMTVGRLTPIVDDITSTALPLGFFDLALCTEVVEHISDSRPAIRNLYRLLSPGGILVLSTPHRYSTLEMTGRIALSRPLIRFVRLVYREPVIEPGHINLMTRRTVEQQLAEAGFHIIERHSSGFYLPIMAELGGDAALAVEQFLERTLRGGRLDGLLWTQHYVCGKQN